MYKNSNNKFEKTKYSDSVKRTNFERRAKNMINLLRWDISVIIFTLPLRFLSVKIEVKSRTLPVLRRTGQDKQGQGRNNTAVDGQINRKFAVMVYFKAVNIKNQIR